MLTKVTSKNQITLPKKVMGHFQDIEYFEISEQKGKIILSPVKIQNAEVVRHKLSQLGINQKEIQAALEWAHK